MIIPPSLLPTLIILTTVIMFLTFAGTYITAKAQKTPVFWSFLLMLGGMLIWLVGRFIVPVAPEESFYVVFVLIQFSGIFLLPGGWFLFCHSLDREEWPQKRLRWLWILVNVVIQTLIFIPGWRLQFIGEISRGGCNQGPLFPALFYGLASLEFLGGCAYLFRYIRRRREKSTLILAFIALLICGASIFTYGAASRFISDTLLGINLIIFTLLMFYLGKYVFLDLSPVSLDAFLSNIQDPILIFDAQGLLVDSNVKTLGQSLDIETIGDLHTFTTQITSAMVEGSINTIQKIDHNMNETIHESIAIKNPCVHNAEIGYFILYASVLLDPKNERIGLVITMSDITSEKLLAGDLEWKNTQLQRIHSQLQDYLSIANRLEEEKERNRIAAEIHHQIGQNISELINSLEDSHSSREMNHDTKIFKLNLVIHQCREVLSQIRKSVNKLMPK